VRPKGWIRGGVGVAIAAAISLPAAGAYALGRAHAAPVVVPLALGDIARENGTTLGCEAKLRAGFRELDCRKFRPLVGTYGAVLTMRGLKVLRYDSASTATLVFEATHANPRAHTCG
jgi:hypothetical protein